MFQIYEISLRKRVERAALVPFFASSFGVEEALIVTSSEYWDPDSTRWEKAIGLDVLLSDTGFRTLCRWDQKGDLSPPDLLKLAMQASTTCRTDAVIGNGFEPPESSADQFLLITPESRIFRTYGEAMLDFQGQRILDMYGEIDVIVE